MQLDTCLLSCYTVYMNLQKIDFKHPELLDNEVFFTNSSLSKFQKMEFRTKRIGIIAYDGKGHQLTHNDWFPVFLSNLEVVSSGFSLKLLRSNLSIDRVDHNI